MTVPGPDTTFSSDCYVPIFPCRAPEREALARLVDPRIAPLLLVRDAEVMAPAIARAWQSRAGMMFVQSAPSNGRGLEARCALATLFERLRSSRVRAVPVVVAGDAWNFEATAGVMRRDGLGVCVRVTIDGVAGATAPHTSIRLHASLAALDATPESTDVLLDIAAQRTVEACADVARRAVNAVSSLATWRNVIVSFTGNPGLLNGASTAVGVSSHLYRDDFAAYEMLRALGVMRTPVFADVGVRLPLIIEHNVRGDDTGARSHLRIVNRPRRAHPSAGDDDVRDRYIGTSWAPPAAPARSAHSHLTRAIVQHACHVLDGLTQKNPIVRETSAS